MSDSPADLLRRAMDAQGVTDPTMRAAIAAIAGGESGFKPRSETSYRRTGNVRIRQIFGSRAAELSDADLDRLKQSAELFFEFMYGREWGARNLGNTVPGDGYLYRGRGLFQLTGRDNYARYGKLTGVDLIGNPDLANDPAVAASIAVAYMCGRYKGGGWEGMKLAVGNSVAGVGETKDRLFAQYLASGEFAAAAAVREGPAKPDPVALQKTVQMVLAGTGDYHGKIDGWPGPLTLQAMNDYRARLGV